MPRVPGEQYETKLVDALANQTISSTLGSDVNGNAVDRDDYAYPDAAKLVFDGQGGLGTSSDSLTFTVQEAGDDGTGSPDTWSDTSETLEISNGTKRNSAQIDLRGLKRHVRIQLDVSDSGQSLGADVNVAGEFVLSGMDEIPQ